MIFLFEKANLCQFYLEAMLHFQSDKLIPSCD